MSSLGLIILLSLRCFIILSKGSQKLLIFNKKIDLLISPRANNAMTSNISSNVPTPPGRAIKTSDNSINFFFPSNKSFVSNISGSNNYLSMEIAFSSYEGEKLRDILKEYDPNFRNIIMKEIEKRKTNDFLGNDNRNQFLNAIRDSMNEFLISKEEDPIIFNAVFKTFVIKKG